MLAHFYVKMHGAAMKADIRDQSSQEQIDFAIFGKSLKADSAHEPVIRSVAFGGSAKPFQHAVVCAGGRFFEKGIRVSGIAHAVDDLAAVAVGGKKILDRVNVLLQIGIH